MPAKLLRRYLVAAMAAAGVLLVLSMVACSAGPDKDSKDKDSKLPGAWLYEGKADQPCAIFQQGRILLLVNENGELATGRITEATKFVVLKGDGWEEGLVGELAEKGKAISWANGTTWKRP